MVYNESILLEMLLGMLGLQLFMSVFPNVKQVFLSYLWGSLVTLEAF